MQEGGGAGRQHDVADEGQAHSRPGRHAVDGHHQRDSEVVPGAHHRVEVVAQARADALAGAQLRVLKEIVAGEVGAGTEAPARAGEQHRADLRIGRHRRRGGAQILDELQVQRIELILSLIHISHQRLRYRSVADTNS